MAETQAQRQVSILAALAQPTRLQILDRVADAGPEGVAAGDIARAIRCPASTLSFHLKELSRTGVLEARPDGPVHPLFAAPAGARRPWPSTSPGLAGTPPARRGRKGAGGRTGRRGRQADASQLTIFGD